MNNPNEVIITLNWSKLYELSDLDLSNKKSDFGVEHFYENPFRGIYMYGFEVDIFRPFYIGKSESNILGRLCEHLVNIRAGNFPLRKIDDLKNGVTNKYTEDINKVIFSPYYYNNRKENWNKHFPEGYGFVLNNWTNYDKSINEMLSAFRFSYAQVDDIPNNDKNEIIKDAEWVLVDKLGCENLLNLRTGDRTPKWDKVTLINKGKISLEKEMDWPKVIK
ncbi:MAG: hypothetical protein FVQ77_12905 [Cytophagales bacterium]|nr:hypothetical protein [Cytophagales bacterium]